MFSRSSHKQSAGSSRTSSDAFNTEKSSSEKSSEVKKDDKTMASSLSDTAQGETAGRSIPAYEMKRPPVRTLGGTPQSQPQAQAQNERHAHLHVGRGLDLKGEIRSCEALVIEGNVEAEIESGSLTVGESGVVKGQANVDEAEIEGNFDGTLNVKGCLAIKSTGKVRGTIHYGELRVEQGGQLTGELDVGTPKAGAKSGNDESKTGETQKKAVNS